MKFITIIVFLIPVVVATHHHRTLLETILKSEGNLFTKVADDVQHVLNNMFDLLNLETNFIAKSRINSLLTMHYDLKSISEKNYDVYEKMEDAAKPDSRNTSSNNIVFFRLTEALLDDKYSNLSGRQNDDTRKYTKHEPQINNTITAESDFVDSKEFMQFFRDFKQKINSISEKDFFERPPALPTDKGEENNDGSNLMVWHPPPVLILDYVNDTNTRRIYRGKKSSIKSYPFVVSIHIMGAFTCAGSLISKDLVISAASCLQLLYNNRFYRENPRAVFVRVGSDYYASGGDKIEVIESYFNPSYNPKTLANNLVILRLMRQIRFRKRSPKVKRILIDRSVGHLAANTPGIIVLGWGFRKYNELLNQFERILVARLDIYHIDECAEIYSKKFVTDRHFCAGFITSGGGACNKDLGGPGIIGGKLAGVISFGAPVCGSVDAPTVFTKVGHYAKWIDEILNMPSHAIKRATTLLPLIQPTFPTGPKKHTRGQFIPHTSYTEEYEQYKPYTDEPIENQEPAENPEDYISLKTILHELARSNSSLLYDILYGDPEYNFAEIFETTTPLDPVQHPLVNKSIIFLPGIHLPEDAVTTKSSRLYRYSTIPLTLATTLLPKPFTDPLTTTRATPRLPQTTEEDPIVPVDLLTYEDEEDNLKHDTTHKDTTLTTTSKPIKRHHYPHHHHYRAKSSSHTAQGSYNSYVRVNTPHNDNIKEYFRLNIHS